MVAGLRLRSTDCEGWAAAAERVAADAAARNGARSSRNVPRPRRRCRLELDDTCRKRCGDGASSLCLGGAFLEWPALVGRVEMPFATHAKVRSVVPREEIFS